jgi:parvulin-like peptidyl-prolyl isomerase
MSWFRNISRSNKNEGLKALVLCFLLTACFSQKTVIGKKVALKINNTEITTQEFADRLAQKLKNYDAIQVKDAANLEGAKKQTIEDLVMESLIQQYCAKTGITVSNDELEAEVNKIRTKYPDDNAFKGALTEEGMSFDRWKAGIKITLLQRKLIEHLSKDLPEPKDAEMKAYYEQNKKSFERPARIQLRQIVVATEDNAKRIYDDVVAGKDFAELAKKFSVAPEGENGGVTNWIEKGTLEVFDNAFKLKVGERSKIVKSPYGYHIYQVLKKENETKLNFDQAKASIRTALRERQEHQAFATWLEEQLKSSTVMRNDALIKAIQVTTRGS